MPNLLANKFAPIIFQKKLRTLCLDGIKGLEDPGLSEFLNHAVALESVTLIDIDFFTSTIEGKFPIGNNFELIEY